MLRIAGYAACLGVFLALALGAGVSCPDPVSAQTVPPSDEVLNEAKAQDFRRWMEKNLNSPDDLKRTRARDVLGRAVRGVTGNRVLGVGTKAGLAGLAVGSWAVVYWELKYLTAEGTEASYQLKQELKAAEGAAPFLAKDPNQRYVIGYPYKVRHEVFTTGYARTSVEVFYALEGAYLYSYYGCSEGEYQATSGEVGVQSVASWSAPYWTWCKGGSGPALGSVLYDTNNYNASYIPAGGRMQVRDYLFTGSGIGLNRADPGFSDVRYFGPELRRDVGVQEFDIPTFDVGSGTPVEVVPPEGDMYTTTPAEGDQIWDQVQADPEYDPAPPDEAWEQQHERRIGELTPTHGPVEWTRDNPDGSRTTRFRDGTELTTWPDKTELVKRADGTEEWKYPDGVKRQWNPNTGEEKTTWPDGTTRIRRWNDPSQRNQNPPDSEEWKSPGGTVQPAPSPTQYPEPPTKTPPGGGGGGGTTNQSGMRCSSPPEGTPVMPPIKFEEKFPFALILWVWEGFGQMDRPASAPTWELGFLGTVDLSNHAGSVGFIRNVIWLVLGLGMPIFFYMLIKGGE